MVIHGGDLFLDDMTSSDVEKQLGVRLGFTENNGHTLLAAILGK